MPPAAAPAEVEVGTTPALQPSVARPPYKGRPFITRYFAGCADASPNPPRAIFAGSHPRFAVISRLFVLFWRFRQNSALDSRRWARNLKETEIESSAVRKPQNETGSGFAGRHS